MYHIKTKVFDCNFQIEALCQSHQKELQQMLAEQALEHSASKTAHLYSKVNAQEVSTNVPKTHSASKTSHLYNKVNAQEVSAIVPKTNQAS